MGVNKMEVFQFSSEITEEKQRNTFSVDCFAVFTTMNNLEYVLVAKPANEESEKTDKIAKY